VDQTDSEFDLITPPECPASHRTASRSSGHADVTACDVPFRTRLRSRFPTLAMISMFSRARDRYELRALTNVLDVFRPFERNSFREREARATACERFALGRSVKANCVRLRHALFEVSHRDHLRSSASAEPLTVTGYTAI
jgi:hypothetical protein